MATEINVGLLGAGRIGRVHAENLAYRIPEVNLAAVADVFLQAAEMQVFIDCIQQDTLPPVTGIDGRIPVMGLAAWKSYRENRPVKLSEIL